MIAEVDAWLERIGEATADLQGQPPPALGDEELAEIAEWADAASPGPWFVDRCGEFDDPYYSIPSVCRDRYGDNTLMVGSDKATAEFIAHARTDVPRLIAALREKNHDPNFCQGCTSGPARCECCGLAHAPPS